MTYDRNKKYYETHKEELRMKRRLRHAEQTGIVRLQNRISYMRRNMKKRPVETNSLYRAVELLLYFINSHIKDIEEEPDEEIACVVRCLFQIFPVTLKNIEKEMKEEMKLLLEFFERHPRLKQLQEDRKTPTIAPGIKVYDESGNLYILDSILFQQKDIIKLNLMAVEADDIEKNISVLITPNYYSSLIHYRFCSQ